MALTITATITLNDDQAYTPLEARIIAAMQAHPSNGAAAVLTPAEPAAAEPAAAPKAAAKSTRATKPAPAPASAASTTPAVLDTTLDEKPTAAEIQAAHDNMQATVAAQQEEEADDLVGGDAEYTLDDAVTLATTRINESKRAQVVAALKAAGVKKVGELKGNAAGLTTFMEALA